MIPPCSHTGVPIHFHSSTTSGSSSLISARILLRVFPRQSVSSAIRLSISSEADCSFVAFDFFIFLSSKSQALRERIQTSIHPRQDLFHVREEFLPSIRGALIGLLLVRPEA